MELASRVASAYDANGVDRTLVREFLALTPAQRMARLEDFLESLATVRRGDSHAAVDPNS